MKQILRFIVFILAIFYVGCIYQHAYIINSDTKATLINGLQSYQSIDLIKEYFDKQQYRWDRTESSTLPENDKRPRVDIYIVSIKNYVHLGYKGELCLEFFNNRLMKTVFYPEDYSVYINALTKITNVRFNNRELFFTESNIRVYAGKNFENIQYVCWEDIRLVNETRDWIWKYS